MRVLNEDDWPAPGTGQVGRLSRTWHAVEEFRGRCDGKSVLGSGHARAFDSQNEPSVSENDSLEVSAKVNLPTAKR